MSSQSKQNMESYWDEKITWWADSSYEEKPGNLWEKFMARLRRSVHARAVIALEVLEPHIEGKTVLDMGCGSGHFLTECIKAGAAKGIGLDIAPQAVELAQSLAKKNGFEDKLEFAVGKAGQKEFPEADIITGFGLVDWLETKECLQYFQHLKDKEFIFSFSDQDYSFDEIVHYYYLVKRLELFGGGVRVYHHPAKVIFRRLHKVGIHDFRLISDKSMRFGRLVTNLPE